MQYHYHGIPYCTTKVIDRPGEHSHLFGYLFDGFPVYGPQGQGGTLLTPANLDECNGHSEPTPEFPEDIYLTHNNSSLRSQQFLNILAYNSPQSLLEIFHHTCAVNHACTGNGASDAVARLARMPIGVLSTIGAMHKGINTSVCGKMLLGLLKSMYFNDSLRLEFGD